MKNKFLIRYTIFLLILIGGYLMGKSEDYTVLCGVLLAFIGGLNLLTYEKENN